MTGYLRSWSVCESVWTIHVGIAAATVVFATLVMVSGVREMYAAKLSVATGEFRLKKRGHKHHEQFAKERSIELLLYCAENIPPMDKDSSDPYVDVRLGEAAQDYEGKGNCLGTKKYWRSPMIPDTNNPVWFEKGRAAADAQRHHVTTLSTTGLEEPEVHLRIYDQDTFSEDDFIGEVRIPVTNGNQGSMVAQTLAVVDQEGAAVVGEDGTPTTITIAWWRHTLHHQKRRGRSSMSMASASGPRRGSVTINGIEEEAKKK